MPMLASAAYESPDGQGELFNPYKRLSERGVDRHSADIGLQGRSKAKINAGWRRRWRRSRWEEEETQRMRRQPPENNSHSSRRPPTPRPAGRGTSNSARNSMHFVFPLAILVFVIVGVSSATPPMTTMKVVPILQREETRTRDGEFTLKYVTGDGIVLAEVGRLKSTADNEDVVLVKEGSYSYTSPEGKVVRLSYVADEMGFRPVAWNVAPDRAEEEKQ